jgi:fumarylacetoacetate (FAA) hydrolase
MKLASQDSGRDGRLLVVSQDLSCAVAVPEIAPTLQHALDHWACCAPRLDAMYRRLNAGDVAGAVTFDPAICAAPLPRAYQWADGSAYVNHVELVRRARGAQMPESFWTDPLMYQGGSDVLLGPCDDIPFVDQSWGLDFESEIAVVTDDVVMGTTPGEALGRVRLLVLLNDVSLRGLIPGELAKGFGFFQSKPATAFSTSLLFFISRSLNRRPSCVPETGSRPSRRASKSSCVTSPASPNASACLPVQTPATSAGACVRYLA